MSKYSIRKGTESEKLKPLKTDVVKDRSRKLTEEYKKIKELL
jgi:tRNA A37 methylthiotransferase MiaB